MKKQFIIIMFIAAAASAIAFYAFPGVTELWEKIGFAICFGILVPQLFAIWALLTSLGVFKKELKVAYFMLAMSSLLLSLNQLQLPLFWFITVDPIALSWGVTISTLLGSALMYISMHRFAKLLALRRGFWGAFPLVTVFAAALALATAFIPHIPYPFSERTIDGIFGTYVAAGGFALAAAVLAWRIKNKLGPSYRVALRWIVVCAAALALSSFHETLLRLLPVLNQESFLWYPLYGVSLWPLFLVSISFLGAGLAFRKLRKELADLPEDASYLDVINYTAQLVSDPQAIDVPLDKIRQITARQGTTNTLSSADQATVVAVYKEIEAYLVTKEPLRKITKEDLRARLPHAFLQAVEEVDMQ
jgi:hypothetical protein